jgi:hypothetical protein
MADKIKVPKLSFLESQIIGSNRELPVKQKQIKKFGLSFFSFQFNAQNRFVISHTVRLW